MIFMKMRIHEILCWYQKKIGTYDKQQWEKTIEHRILHGLNHIHPMKTKPPKTEFIDLDLVRGTSFPKAKPKHGFITVTKLATLRLFLLPLYSKWWAGQTSAKIFGLLLLLYVLQLVNIALYFHTTNKPTDTSITEIVSSSEIIIPILMMFILSIIHSQIVSTHTGPDKVLRKTKTRRTKRLRRRILKRMPKTDQKSLPESNIDAQNNFHGGPFEKFRKISSELRHRNNIWAEQEQTIVKRERAKKNVNLTLNVKFNLNDESEKRHSEHDVEIGAVAAADDDGFESFNGCGSSENGEEIVTLAEVKCDNGDAGEVSSTPPKINDSNNTLLNEILNIDNSKTKLNDNDYSSGAQSDTESDREGNRRVRSPKIDVSCPMAEANILTTEYLGITTNSEDCSYSSEYDESDSQNECNHNDNMWDYDLAPTVILSPSCAPSDRVSCTIWENRDIKKADLSVLDISSAIIARVETMPETPDYFYGGVVLSILLAFLPPLCRLSESMADADINKAISVIELPSLMVEKLSGSLAAFMDAAFGYTLWERSILSIALIERLSLSCLFFFLLAVAERTFKQRFLYAKLFSHLTSSRRARKSELPHFRLNKVRNIKTWLSVRSYLKRRGPQRSVDVIVSTAFIITLLLLSFISMELLKDSIAVHSQYNFEAVVWCFGLGIFLLRFMTLGTKINRKNRNLSVLITEQINLYLQIEQKPHKKDKLMVANSVLKLAADLLKELESPFKISGLSANPYLYNITKVVILSALSGVLSEMLGFKVKLTKINIK